MLETEHAATFLLRRTRRHSASKTTCCWAVLEEDAALAVYDWITAQQFAEALRLLNLQAKHLGTMLPETADDELLRSYP